MICNLNRALFAALAFALVSCTAHAPRSAPRTSEPTSTPPLVTEITTTVSDLNASTRFFVEGLGAEVLDTREASGSELDALLGLRGARLMIRRLRVGEERLSLMQFLAPTAHPSRSGGRSNDLDFQHVALVVSDMDRMHQRVMSWNVAPITLGGPQRIPESNAIAAGIRAFYFRDFDQRPLELIWYPGDKGNPRWHNRTGPLLLGVDHTAIAVSSTQRSRDFYEGILGLALRGESLNQGVEQAALTAVAGARVRITGLGGPSGPGVEFLEYQAPTSGVHPPALSPATIGYWETSVRVSDLEATVRTLAAQERPSLSRRISLCETCSVGRRAFIVYDPDGHPVRVVGD